MSFMFPLFFSALTLFLLPRQSSAKLLDKIFAVVDSKTITLSQIKRIQKNIKVRQNIFPLVYHHKEYTHKKIADILIHGQLIRHKLTTIGYIISDEQVEGQIKTTEKRLGLNRAALLQFLEQNQTTFDEYFEIMRSTIEYNVFISKIINPLISITEQEIKNTFFKMNSSNKTLAFKYELVDFSLNKKLFKGSMKKDFKGMLKKYQSSGELPRRFKNLQTNVIDNVTEDGLTPALKKALKKTNEGHFTRPIAINNSLHIFYIKKKNLVESSIYQQSKKKIYNMLFERSLKKVAASWYAREATEHYIKYFL